MKKLIPLLLVLIYLLNSVTVYANPSEDRRWTVNSRIQILDEQIAKNYGNQDGLLRKVQFISAKMLWVQFAIDKNGTHEIGFTSNEINDLISSLERDIKNFNSVFSVTPPDSSFKVLKLDIWTSSTNAWTSIEKNIKTVIPNYIESLLKEILKEYNEAEDEASKNNVIREKGEVLRYSHRILDGLVTLRDDIIMLSEGLLHVTDSVKARDLLSNSSTYNILIQQGKKLDISANVSGNGVSFTEEDTLIQTLANVVPATNAEAKYGADLWAPNDGGDGTFKLNDIYLRFLASGSVYKPFVSKVGETSYIEALRGLYEDPQIGDKAIEIYQKAKASKKPLSVTDYKGYTKWFESKEANKNGRTTSRSGDYTESGNYLSLGQFIELIDSKTQFGLVVKKGVLKENVSDMNSYSYFSDNTENATQLMSNGDGEGTGLIWSSPVLTFNSNSNATTDLAGSMTATILRNIKNNVEDIDSIADKDYPVFMNGLGDIVTYDDTVILPAIANPLIYKSVDKGSYYPYTVAFTYYYPPVKPNSGGMETVLEPYSGSYVYMNTDEKFSYMVASALKGSDSLGTINTLVVPRVRTDLAEPIGGITTMISEATPSEVLSYSYFPAMLQSFGYIWKSFIDLGNSNESYSDFGANTKVYYYSDILINRSISLFRYNSTLDSEYEVARYLARNTFTSFIKDKDGNDVSSYDVLDHDFIFRNILLEGLNGSIYAKSLVKNITTENLLVDSTDGIMKNFARFLVNESVNIIGYGNGYLGMKSLYESSVFGPVLSVIDEYIIILFVAISVLFILKYYRDGEYGARLFILMVSVFISLMFFLKWLPIYLPHAHNFFANNISDELGYDILTLKSERYDKTYKESGHNVSSGTFNINSTTLTLYKFSDSQLAEFISDNSIDRKKAVGGNVYVVDSENGIFFEGNSLKVSIDVLFQNYPIQGQWSTDSSLTGGSLSYYIKADKMMPSSVDYYTPYSSIQDGFIDTLNKLPKVFSIPNNVLTYRSGIVKDSFMVMTYSNSAPFLDPTNYDNPEYKFSPEQISALEANFDNHNQLYNSYDFLNLDRMLTNASSEMKQSLWYKTMYDNGYLDDTEKYWGLIESVNLLTKKFIIGLGDQVYTISDENLIKVISIYASNVFNQKISNFGSAVYPSSLNYQDFYLEDIYMSILTNDYNKFIAEDSSLASISLNRAGTFGSFLVALDLWLTYIVKTVTDSTFIFLFIAFSFIFLFRFMTSRKVEGMLKGAFISTATLFLISVVYYIAFGMSNNMGPFTSILFLTILHLICLYVLFILVTSILMNVTEFGNGKFKATLDKFGGNLTSKMFNGVKRSLSERGSGRRVSNRYSDLYGRGADYDGNYLGRYAKGANRRYYSRYSRNYEEDDRYNYYRDNRYRNQEKAWWGLNKFSIRNRDRESMIDQRRFGSSFNRFRDNRRDQINKRQEERITEENFLKGGGE